MTTEHKKQSGLQLQMQRLREQGVRRRFTAGVKKLTFKSFGFLAQRLHKQPRVRKIVISFLNATGLKTRVKRFLTPEPQVQPIYLSARALEIRKEIRRMLAQQKEF